VLLVSGADELVSGLVDPNHADIVKHRSCDYEQVEYRVARQLLKRERTKRSNLPGNFLSGNLETKKNVPAA
jgi:hypothetical protein